MRLSLHNLLNYDKVIAVTTTVVMVADRTAARSTLVEHVSALLVQTSSINNAAAVAFKDQDTTPESILALGSGPGAISISIRTVESEMAFVCGYRYTPDESRPRDGRASAVGLWKRNVTDRSNIP